MQKVKATSNIKHNGTLYEAGQEFQVNEDQAAQLLVAGVIQPIKNIKPKKEEVESVPDKKADKKSEEQGTEEVANMKVTKNMSREKLRGVALAMGLEVEKTAVRDEIYEMIEEVRGVQSESEEEIDKKDESVQDEDEDQVDKKD